MKAETSKLQNPFESGTGELSRRMSCSCDHPRTQRRLPFFDSNNRHSPESRAVVSLDISVHAHGGYKVLPIANIARAGVEKERDSWEPNSTLNCVETRKYYCITCTFNTPMNAHTRNVPTPPCYAPTRARSLDVFQALITNEIRSQTRTRRSISVSRSVAYVLREVYKCVRYAMITILTATTPDRLRSSCNRGVASIRCDVRVMHAAHTPAPCEIYTCFYSDYYSSVFCSAAA